MSRQKKGSPDTGPQAPAPGVETGTMRTGLPPAVSPATVMVVASEADMWRKKYDAKNGQLETVRGQHARDLRRIGEKVGMDPEDLDRMPDEALVESIVAFMD